VDWTNDRVRDVIDLTMLRRHFYPEVGVDQHSEVRPDAMLVSLRAACLDLFDSRAAEAETLGVLVRRWPPTITPNDVWYDLYPDLAASVGLNLTLEDAVAGVHDWIERISVAVDIDTAPSPQL
jgi:hypothetical protein